MLTIVDARGVQLEKVGHYTLGDHKKAISPADIKRAERMVWCVGGVTIVLCSIYLFLNSLHPGES